MPSLSEDLIAQAIAYGEAFATQPFILVTPAAIARVGRAYANGNVPLLPKRERAVLLAQYETVFAEAVRATIARQFRKVADE